MSLTRRSGPVPLVGARGKRTGRRHRGAQPGLHPPRPTAERPLRDRAIVHLLLGTGLRRAELVALDLSQLEPNSPEGLRRAKRARLSGVRGKGRTSRTLFLGLNARQTLADYLDREQPGDADQATPALFVAAWSIAARRADGRLSPRSVNAIVARSAACTTPGRRRPGPAARHTRPHDLRRPSRSRCRRPPGGHSRAELQRRLGHANDRYLRLYANPPEGIAAGWVENL